MDVFGFGNQRKPFGIVTKRIEWLLAAKTDTAKRALDKYLVDGKPPARLPRSKCRNCRRLLTWGSGTYNFDHFDNRCYNNSQKNCRLVCRNCHGEATKTKKVREYDPLFGDVVGYRTQKLKAGYKKARKKPARRATGKGLD